MKILNFAGRVLLGLVSLLAAQMIVGMLIAPTMQQQENALPWLLFANLLSVTVLGWAGMRSGWRGLKLLLALFALPAAIGTVNLIEGMFFLPNAGIDFERLLPMMLLGYALAAPAWAFLFRGPATEAAPPQQRSWTERIGRFALSDVTYLVLYFFAGMIIFRWVADYYATQRLPSMGTIVALQLSLRGPVFVGLCILLARMLRYRGLSSSLAVGLVFTILSGVAPLIIPNPFFPDAVRWVHFGEVVSSNFVFGAVVAWIWRERRASVPLAQPVSATT